MQVTAPPSSATDVAFAAQLACMLEASAPKPGNVTPLHGFHDARYEDFLASAAAIGPVFAAAGDAPLGRLIHGAVEATARRTRANTNLGIVLLLAPIARAARMAGDEPLRDRLAHVLASTTVDDAAEVYAAIRLAQPGGLGRAAEQDVSESPSVPLRETMALAGDRDAVAREYVTDFAITFEVGAPAVERARADGLPWSDATLETYLVLLSAQPDTLVTRKLGADRAAAISRDAGAALAAGGVRSRAGRVAVAELDRALRDARNRENPGTTADLTAAALFVHLLGGGWP